MLCINQEIHLQHLYEEMDQQIQKERKAIKAEEELKEQRARKDFQGWHTFDL